MWKIAKHEKNGSEDRIQRSGAGKNTTTIGAGKNGWMEGMQAIEDERGEVERSAEWNYRTGDGARPGGLVWDGLRERRDDEKPVHRVWVDAFELAAYQVTNAEYGRFLAETSGAPPPCWGDANFHHPKMPVAAVSWHEPRVTASAERRDRKRYRLPSEAEWERAARGGAEGLLYPWGDAPPEMVPDYDKRGSWTEPWLYARMLLALQSCDNVHEWCADWYDDGYYGRSRNEIRRGRRAAPRACGRSCGIILVTRTRHVRYPPEFQYADYVSGSPSF